MPERGKSKLLGMNTFKLTVLAMLAAISVVLILLVRFPLIPAAPFLEYDMADVPVLIATFMFDPVAGLLVLLITSAIQAFLLGGNSWVGFIMHFVSSGAMVLVAGIIYRAFTKTKPAVGLVSGLVVSVIVATGLMIPLNLVLTPLFMGTDVNAVKQLLLPAIIPFNLIKFTLNGVLSGLLWIPVSRIYKKVVKNRQTTHKQESNNH